MVARAERTGARLSGIPAAIAVPLLAAAAGALATVEPVYAAALVVAAALILLVAADPAALPVFLVLTMFVESVALGPGLRIGRLAGGMALAVLAYVVLERGTAGLRANALLAAAGGFGGWATLSLYWAEHDAAVVDELLSYVLVVAYMLAFAILVRQRAHLKLVFLTFALAALAFGVVSFASYLAVGWDYVEEGLGATGLQGDKNYFAVYQVLSLPAALTLAALERRSVARAGYYGIVAVIVLSVVASLSRTGFLALAGAVLVTVLLPWRWFFRAPGHKAAYVLALAAAGTVVAVTSAGPFVERAETIVEDARLEGHGSTGRLDLWRAAWHAYEEHPALGVGLGNFQEMSTQLLRTTPGSDLSAPWAREPLVVHSIYLETLTELGPLGLALLLAVLVFTARLLLLARRRARASGDRPLELYSAALLASLFAYAISGFFLSHQLGKPLWILVGLALALDVMTRRSAPAEP